MKYKVQDTGQQKKSDSASSVTCGCMCVMHVTHDHFPDHLTYRTILWSSINVTLHDFFQEKTCASVITLQPNVRRLL